jgi:very-short-patch-repair endonuclease
MLDPKWLTRAIEQARRDLIDLTRRNRLLHAPLDGKRPWCMAITGQSPDELFEKLYRQENFRGYAFKPRKEESSEEQALAITSKEEISSSQEAASTRRPRLQTQLAPDKLQKRLAKIFREERTLEEEQGLSTLYLALGFLNWFDSDQAEASFAPLLLVPVTMVRVGGADGYLLRGRDDEIVSNISLREKLKSNFDINLSDVPDDDQWHPSSYYNAVAREVSRQQRWRVDPQAVGLGFFTFSKFLMWRDLHPDSWPNNSLLDHPLVNVLLGQGSEAESFQPLVPDDEPIDQHIDISKCTHVVDADSSQAIVIEEARAGRNLVVQGPPGTGKSQTITNAIASAVHSGKTILFVAEKTAALEVVHDRLRRAGLGALCLEIHSRKANKRAVVTSLEQALRFAGDSQIDSNLPSLLAARRDKLNQWSIALHKPIGESGRTGFDVIGRQVKLRSEGVRLLEDRLDEAANWTATKLSSLEVAVDHAAAGVSNLRVVPKDHPWFGTNIDAQSPFDLERLLRYLNAAIERIEVLEKETTKIIAAVSSNDAPSIADSIAAIRAFRHVAAVPKQFRSILANPTWAGNLAAFETAIEQSQKLASSIGEVEGHFRKEAWACDTGALLLILRRVGGSIFRRLSSRYRRANAELRALCRNKPPKELRDRIALVEMLQSGQECRQEFAEKARLLKPALGSMWADYKTEWTDVREIAAWARSAIFELGGAKLLVFAARAQDLRVYADFADKLEGMAKAAAVAFDDVQKLVRASLPTVFESQNCENISMRQLSSRIATWRDNLQTVNDWVAARNAIIHLRSEGLGIIADGLINNTILLNEARSITELLIAESLWRRATAENPELSTLDGNARTQCVLEFRDFDQQRIRTARQEVVARYLNQRPNGYAGAMGVIRAEINKRRGHRPIRKLMTDAGSAVQQLKPIFLMSPLSVAQFLPPGRLNFSILVIDEASQVAPEDALGVVARANQIVVVGDDKQLPPTNFFKMVNAGDEYEEDSEQTIQPDRPTDFESILTLARTRGISERMLAWHYRSKHPSLIALSNEECYAGRLLMPPSPFVQTSDFGLSQVQTPRGHYDRGGTRCDLVQAEEVAKAIAKHIRSCPNKSLGVACLSVQQRDAVDDMIDKIGIRADVEGFTPKEERLFVKNLEAIQGDERDVIFISVGYGVAPNQSKPFLNFGPVSQEGGERRLNVLASRAREKCVVFSSITSADIPADSESRGTRMLRALLNFAETGKLGAGTLQGDGFESPFEEAVARKIREAGFHIHPQVGVKSFRIDLGVIDPTKPGEYILGVECDGAAYHSARSARDRDRLRQEVLEGLGWRLHRIWSTEWFRNPQRETNKLLAAIREAQNKAVSPKTELVSDDDLPELDEEDSTAETAPHDVNDETDIPSNTSLYKECVLTVPFRRDLLDLPISETSRFALEIVEAEGPIHTHEVARRIREAFGLQKTGKRILAHIKSSLDHLSRNGRVSSDGEFWSAVGQNISTVRNRRHAALPLRRATMISPAEYQIALSTIVADAVTISGNDLVVETARMFGFDRTGPDLKEVIDRQVERLVKEGRIVLDESGLRFPNRDAPTL